MSPKTSPKGEFEGLEAASTKCEWLGVRITVRIWIFGVSRVIMLFFFLYFAQKRIRVGPLASLALGLVVLSDYLRKIAFFSDSSIFFHFSSIFRVFGHLELFFMDRRLFIMKKDRFWPFYQLSVFSGVGGIVKRKKRLFSAVLSDFGIFRCWRHRKT